MSGGWWFLIILFASLFALRMVGEVWDGYLLLRKKGWREGVEHVVGEAAGLILAGLAMLAISAVGILIEALGVPNLASPFWAPF